MNSSVIGSIYPLLFKYKFKFCLMIVLKSAEILRFPISTEHGFETAVSISTIFNPNFQLLKPACLETSIIIPGTNWLYTSEQIKQRTKEGQGSALAQAANCRSSVSCPTI
jgi:hypothetical protein